MTHLLTCRTVSQSLSDHGAWSAMFERLSDIDDPTGATFHLSGVGVSPYRVGYTYAVGLRLATMEDCDGDDDV